MNQDHYFKIPYNDATEVNKSQLVHQLNISIDYSIRELYYQIRCPTGVSSFPFQKPHRKTFCPNYFKTLYPGLLLRCTPIYKNRSLPCTGGSPLNQIFKLQSTETNFSQLIGKSSSLKRHWEAHRIARMTSDRTIRRLKTKILG